jgi:glutamate racemase
VRIALVDSGIGLLSTAAELRRLRPDAHLVLSMDPDHMPWGVRSETEIARRALAGARAALETGPVDAIAVPCNTASVYALEHLRAVYEPGVPVVGTVPPVKPAAEWGGPFAVWSTPATSRSAYQSELITRFADPGRVSAVGCTGLAEAVESGEPQRIREAVADAAGRTPPEMTSIVLGCTHYDLVAEDISAAVVGEPVLFTAATAVAEQTLRRIQALDADPLGAGDGGLTVLASGRPRPMPQRALRYPAGRVLAGLDSGPPPAPWVSRR